MRLVECLFSFYKNDSFKLENIKLYIWVFCLVPITIIVDLLIMFL